MDETGVQHGVANKQFQYVVGASPRKDAPTARKDGSQELTTVIECISADGYALPPAYVFKGRLIDLTLMFEETEGGFMTASDSGWTNTAIAQHWFEKVFLPASKELSKGSENRLLIMDGHTSHFTLEMLKLAVENKVHILSLPSHSTHGLAPLDRACFGPLKTAWAEAQRTEMMMTGVVRKEDVIRLYQTARKKALTSANITKGYAATGIWPLTGIKAIPQAMMATPPRTEAEMEEEKNKAYLSNELADALHDLAGRQRSEKARSTLVKAARSTAEAGALNVLFEDLMDRLRKHAAYMKAKPRAFRVAQPGYGKAKLYTAAEAMLAMEEAIQAKQDEIRRKELEAEEREQRREEKEKAAEEAKKKREAEKVARDIKKAREEKEKAERRADRLKRKAEKEAELAKKPKKPRKNSQKQPTSGTSSEITQATTSTSPLPLQPTQLVANPLDSSQTT
ncbi:hypothetical protein CF319_g7014 [Tilletia indica]|nr:hypothetical protein CF319_g7014 [Tilletia indica]